MKKLYIILAVLFLAAIGTFTYFYRKGFSNNIRGNEGYVSGTNNKSEITRNIEESKSDNFSFAIIGDTKSFGANNPDGNLQKAVKSINKNNPDFAFVMGDLVSSCDGGSSCVKKFDDWKKVLGSLVNKTYEVVGNHDRTGGSKADKVWQDEFSLPQNGPDDFKGQTFSFDFRPSLAQFFGQL